ncbi:MAG: phosphotransferase [Deltaproteobacteria bacterium]|nr:phosphotransferase [Deltaproteobacteria bacterium]
MTTTEAFAALATDEQVARLAGLANRALAAWDLAAPRVELVKYRENAVFLVTAADGTRAILRVHRPRYRSDDDIRSEFAWMRALDADGIPTPAAIPTRTGDGLTTVGVGGVPEPRQCDLMTWVPGKPPGTLEAGVAADAAGLRALYRAVGGLAARMHAHAAAWPKPARFSRPAWNVATLVGDAPTFGRFWKLGAIGAEEMPILLAARDRVRERLATRPADVLIHGDLVPDNILVDGATTRVIDFDDFGWSWIGFEVATSLYTLRMAGGFDDALAGYLEGYREVRPFPAADLELLPDLLMARGLSYLGWPVGRPEIESTRNLVPMLVYVVTDEARQYLAATG